ncbi:porin family protein [Porphyromonadaceae bacterium W3.11]|nr:porin family protein [Porphyromonadaceae bacterium W3.11]
MKRFFLGIVFMLAAVVAMAQYRPTFIVHAGYQGANIYNMFDNAYVGDMKPGIRLGATMDYTIYKLGFGEISIQPGLYYSTKGTKLSDAPTVNLRYLDLLVLANCRFGVSEYVDFFANVGPYVSYGFASNISGIVAESKHDIGDDDRDSENLFNPFDTGIQVAIGTEYKRIQLTGGVQLGFANIAKRRLGADDIGLKANRSFFVMLGYRF